jgi:hypothetical protein
MKTLLRIISFVGLGLTIVPAILVFNGIISLETHHTLIAVGMGLWFMTAPFWLGKPAVDES